MQNEGWHSMCRASKKRTGAYFEISHVTLTPCHLLPRINRLLRERGTHVINLGQKLEGIAYRNDVCGMYFNLKGRWDIRTTSLRE